MKALDVPFSFFFFRTRTRFPAIITITHSAEGKILEYPAQCRLQPPFGFSPARNSPEKDYQLLPGTDRYEIIDVGQHIVGQLLRRIVQAETNAYHPCHSGNTCSCINCVPNTTIAKKRRPCKVKGIIIELQESSKKKKKKKNATHLLLRNGAARSQASSSRASRAAEG